MNDVNTNGVIKPGDIITMSGNFEDRRNWWHRKMPYWLGGKDAPNPPVLNRFVVTVTTSRDFEK